MIELASPRGLFAMRHGRTDWNALGRLQGHTDTPLNREGRAEAQAAGHALRGRGIRQILTSPLSRAFETAQIVGAALDLTPRPDPRLIERRFGALEGRIVVQVEAEMGLTSPLSVSDRLPPDAESWAVLNARAAAVLTDAVTQPGTLIVSHYATIRAVAGLCGLQIRGPENCEVIAL